MRRPLAKAALASILFAGALLAVAVTVEAQQAKKVPRIGYITNASFQSVAVRYEAFRQGLHELGYGDGKNIIIEYRSAEGKPDRFPMILEELARLKVEVIVTGGGTVTRAAKESGVTMPIVMANDSDPVGNGFVASLARPSGNITGLANYRPEISGKQLELLKEIIPRLTRVAVLGTSTQPGNEQSLKETELAAGTLGVKIQYLEVLDSKNFVAVFQAAIKGKAEAMLLMSGAVFTSQRKQIVDLAVKNRLPTVYPQSDYMDDGGLMFYGPNITELFRRAATYVDKILKGARPADLPVEQPKKFEFIINLKAAKQIELTIPPTVVLRADKVIR